MKKESYVQPTVTKHELLRDITAGSSCNNGFGNGGYDCVPGNSGSTGHFDDIKIR